MSLSFDAMGVVVDWIDACRTRHLDALLDLYDVQASVSNYWRPRLMNAAPSAFQIDALMQGMNSVSLDYRGHDGAPVRIIFRFSTAGRISQTACEPVDKAP